MIMNALMEEVLDEPENNTSEYLEKRIIELGNLAENYLMELAKKGKLKSAEKRKKR